MKITSPQYRKAFILVTTLFFMWGLSYGLIDVLNKHFQVTLNVSKAQSGLIQAAYFGAYFVVAIPAGEGHGARKPGGVGFHSLRAGDITSDHKVYFGGMGERLEITHYSYSDDCFARGAVDCAAYLQGKPAGVYSIKDVFDLR